MLHVAGLTIQAIQVPNAGDASDRGKGRAGDLLVRANVAVSKVNRRQSAPSESFLK